MYSYDEVLAQAGDLMELTRQEVFESTDLTDKQKFQINRMQDYAEQLGWKIWLDCQLPGLYFEVSENLYSEVMGMAGLDALGNVICMLELTHACLYGTEKPDRMTQLEERISKIEELLGASPATELQEAGISETKLAELEKRALNIGNRIIVRIDGRLMYCRSRQSYYRDKHPRAIFTDDNILEAQQTRWHINGKWTFEQYELDELEAVVAHDEDLYAERLGNPD